MSKEYIARDPRTGKPLNVSRSKSKKQYIETEQGPWMAIPDIDIIPLAIGEIEAVSYTHLTLPTILLV